MAKLSSDGKYVTVEKGDTLWAIARDFLHLTDDSAINHNCIVLAAINNLANKNLITPGQKIYLQKQSSGSSSNASNSNQPVIQQFGLQADVDNTLFATWTFGKNNIDHFDTEWQYYTKDNVWFVGQKQSVEERYSVYTIPDNAVRVRFHVKPIAKEKKKADGSSNGVYWTANSSEWKTFDVKYLPPDAPPTPSVDIEGYQLTAELDNLDLNASQIEFQIVKNNVSIVCTEMVPIRMSTAKYTRLVAAGAEYKVRARALRGSPRVESEWSAYSNNVGTPPSASSGITGLKALSDTSIQVTWSKVSNATGYTVEYTTEKIYFDRASSEVSSTSTEGKDNNTAILTGLESGKEYFFRVRARNDKGDSAWTAIKSIIIGKKPIAPTTWSSTTSVVAGENLILYWVHNTEDGSNQTGASFHLKIEGILDKYFNLTGSGIWSLADPQNGVPTIQTKFDDEEDEGKTNSLIINTTRFTEGTVIKWDVATKGIVPGYGEYSITRTVDVYAPPTLELSVTDINKNPLTYIKSFPFYIYGLPGPATQPPIGYHIDIVSKESYETVDSVGNPIVINEGDSVYSKYFDIDTELLLEISAGNIDLENGVLYSVKATVSMSSGLTAEATSDFTVSWTTDDKHIPNAEISFDENTYSATIRPYCETVYTNMYKVLLNDNVYTVTSEPIDQVYGEIVDEAFTETGEEVYSGVTADGDEVYYCAIQTSTLVEDVTLSVYRREFDGSFTEIGTNLANSPSTYIIDPHPALDYARYRIVATTISNGTVGYYDLPNFPIGGKAIIIQWDEEWTSFNTFGNPDELAEPAWTGSLLRLPYNVDVSDKNSKDVSLAKYIGRKRPVTYYGTQLGESSTWSVEVESTDEETIYALRRLMVWTGDAYVREPSGTGYWANVSVSFSQKHCELTIPVTLEIVRVEGGM